MTEKSRKSSFASDLVKEETKTSVFNFLLFNSPLQHLDSNPVPFPAAGAIWTPNRLNGNGLAGRRIDMFNRYEWFGRRIEVREVGILLMDLHCSSCSCICFREGLDDGFDLRNRRQLVWRCCTSGLFSGADPAG